IPKRRRPSRAPRCPCAATSRSLMDVPSSFIPQDRRHALARGAALPDRTTGAGLLADLSGFTALTEALTDAYGPARGAEQLTRLLNEVFDTLIDEVGRWSGSVISFAGDAITCWFDDGSLDAGGLGTGAERAATCARALQAAMASFASVPLPGGQAVAL